MNGRHNVGRLISLTLCCLGMAMSCQAQSEQEVAAMAEKTSKADGDEYVKARDELVQMVQQEPQLVKNMKQVADRWQLDVVCGVAIEYAEQAEKIHELTSNFPLPPESRETPTRVVGQGEALIKKAADVPYFLVEQLWKTNALTQYYERTAALAYALGKMRFRAAREPIEALLQHEHQLVRIYAARSLEGIADPKSTPVLFNYLVKGYLSNERVDRSHGFAAEAFSVCARKDFLPTVKAKLKEVEDSPQGEGDGEIVKEQRKALRAFLRVTILALEK